MVTDVFIGIGSNLEQPLQQVLSAFNALRSLPDTELQGASRLYRSAPLEPARHLDYGNAAAHLIARPAPDALLDQLQATVLGYGRVRTILWGPRPLDLDILLFGELTLDTPRLHFPHRELTRRNF